MRISRKIQNFEKSIWWSSIWQNTWDCKYVNDILILNLQKIIRNHIFLWLFYQTEIQINSLNCEKEINKEIFQEYNFCHKKVQNNVCCCNHTELFYQAENASKRESLHIFEYSSPTIIFQLWNWQSRCLIIVSQLVHDLTTENQEVIFSSHKPYIPTQGSLATTSMQTNPLVTHQKIMTSFKNFFTF
jgi:hypothetical protein